MSAMLRLSSLAFAALALLSRPTTESAPAALQEGSRGPMLIVAHGDTATEANDRIGLPAEAHALADEERAAAIARAAMPEASLQRLADALDGLNVRLEARRNPFGEDLEDGDPFDDLYVLLRSVSSALGAASSLSSQRIASSDRHTVVAIAPRCGGTGTECFPAWAPASSRPTDTQRRARFFAWSVSLSATLSFADAAARESAVHALRVASADKGQEATIALALTGEDLAGASNARGATIRERARRTIRLVGGESKAPKLLRVLAAEPAPGQLVPWLSLDAREVLVVPRLGTLANPTDFEAEITRTVGAPTWVHRPTP
jgi:hypothetical protein